MLRLKRYLKPYLNLLVFAIALLFGQAMLELELPNVMSNIVNNGIQKGGITEAAPVAVSDSGFALMTTFMSEEDKALAEQNYAHSNDVAALQKKYPNANENTWVNTATDADTLLALDGVYGRASYAMMQVMQNLMQQSGQEMAQADTASIDMSKVEQLLPMLQQLPPDVIQEAIALAAATPDSTTAQTAAVFVKGFYLELGANTDAIQTAYIWKTGLKMLFLCVLVLLCAIGAGYCLSKLGAGVARDLRHDVFAQVTRFTSNEMDKFSTASLITRTTNDITQIQQFLTMGFRMMCFAPIMGIGGLVMALSKCVSMAWIIAMAVIFMLGVILVLFTVAMPRFKKMQTLIDNLNLVSRENLSGMMVIRAFATQDFEEKRFDTANRELTKNTLFVNRAMTSMMPVMMLLMNAVTLLVVWVGGHQIAASNMQVGDMMAFMQYAMQVVMSFLFISMMFVMVPRASVSAERISDVLDTESTVKDPENPQHFASPLRGTIAFNDVSFRYEGVDENVLEHISFTAKQGETTAFIGSTGSGKSTLINLIPRFYDVSGGSITMDGIDIRDVTQHELRAQIGYVPQKGMLFSGDINSNLRYGAEHASEDTLHHAAAVAQASEFIDTLDNGYETAISQGGTNVSGGQRQRLSIARALVKKAPVYIFDDTFSALDFKTDAKLRAALSADTKNATVLIVAQRISTIMHAQQIVVLEEGHIAGIGTHEELLKNCTAYREIAQSQLSKEELSCHK
ncbi:MAG: ABC transporter ATP-binding protein [Ruthenibacterium sp.]